MRAHERSRLRSVVAVAALAMVFAASGCASSKRFAYEGWGRDDWQQPERVVASLDLRAGERIADVGAGGGYFTFRLAKAVGRDGVVYAVDIDPDMLGLLRERVRDENVSNVEVVAATPDDPGLPAASIDLLFTCNTYHHLDDAVAYFRNARGTLRPGGRVAILDLNDRGWFARWFGHHTPAEKIRADMTAAGYRQSAEHTFVAEQSFLIFAPEA